MILNNKTISYLAILACIFTICKAETKNNELVESEQLADEQASTYDSNSKNSFDILIEYNKCLDKNVELINSLKSILYEHDQKSSIEVDSESSLNDYRSLEKRPSLALTRPLFHRAQKRPSIAQLRFNKRPSVIPVIPFVRQGK